jgi:putative transposase
LFDAPPDPAAIDDLRTYARQQKAWGSDRFRAEIEGLTQRTAGVRPRGRPPAKRRTFK